MKNILMWCLVLLCPALIVLAAIGYNVHAISAWRLSERLQREGIETTAEVIESRKSSSLKTATSYYVKYRYTVQGHIYTQEREVDAAKYSVVGSNRRIEISYLVGRPDRSDLIGNDGWLMKMLLAVMLDFALIGFVLMCFRYAKRSKKSGVLRPNQPGGFDR
jgi:hypothetical protein